MDAGAAQGLAHPAAAESPPTREVLLIDVPTARVRRPADLVSLVLSVAGIVGVLVLAVYARSTTEAVTEDVQTAVGGVVRALLLVPVTVLEGLVTFFVPLIVILSIIFRRAYRQAAEILLAAVLAFGAAQGALWVVQTFAPVALAVGLTRTPSGAVEVAMDPYVAALAALLTMAGDVDRHRSLRWWWTLLWVVLGLSVIQGDQSLPAAIVTVLLGHGVGLVLRYGLGVRHDRASGLSLVRGIRRAGIDPIRVVRLDRIDGDAPVRAWRVTTSAPIGYAEQVRERPRGANDDAAGPGVTADRGGLLGTAAATAADVIAPDVLIDAEAERAEVPLPPTATSPGTTHRVYGVWDHEGRRYDVLVLDGDRQIVGYLAGLWDALRIRGLDRRSEPSLNEAADRATLMMLSAAQAGVRTPELLATAEAHDSVIFATRHLSGLRRLVDLPAEAISEATLDDFWHQLRTAHRAGIAHRDLDGSAPLVDPAGRVWLGAWANGEVTSPELARRVDLVQALVLVAVIVGVERALASAARTLSRDQMASIAALLQPVALPAETRVALKAHRGLLDELRTELVELIPTADVEPVRLERFSVRTVVMVVLFVVALWVLLGSLSFEDIVAAISEANPWWMVGAFALGLLTYLGSAMGLVAFSSEKIGLWKTTLVQVAASVVSLVAPAGIGPAALNLRFLTRRKVPMPVAVATVGLTQITQFVTTVALLVAVALVTGSVGSLQAPSPAVVIAIVVVVAAVGIALAIPKVRDWVWKMVGPTLSQAWPRLVWVAGNPARLALGIGGNLIMTVGYIAAFGACLAAFGHTLSLTTLAITYLGASAAGSAVPSPGGVGPVELALTAGLSIAGIPYGVAFSTAVLFRLLTFWGRVPLGWAALRYLQKREEL